MRDQHQDLPFSPDKIRSRGGKRANNWYTDREHVRRRAPHYSPISNEILALSSTHTAVVTGPDEVTKDQADRLEPDANDPARSAVLDVVLLPSSGLPLLLVNGNVVSVGRGRAEIALPAGSHFVEVQDNHSRAIVVNVKEGERALVAYRYDDNDNPVLGRPPTLKDAIPGSTWRTMARYWLVVAALATGVASAITAFLTEGVAGYLGLIALGLIIFTAAETITTKLLTRRLPPLHSTWELPRQEFYPWSNEDENAAAFLGHSSNCGTHPTGKTAICIDFHLERHLATVPFHRFVPPRWDELAALQAADPQLWINGDPMPCSWGTWRYPVSPGAHVVQIVVDGQPGVTRNLNDENDVITRHAEVTVDHGDVANLKATGSVYFVRKIADEETTHYKPRLWVEINQHASQESPT